MSGSWTDFMRPFSGNGFRSVPSLCDSFACFLFRFQQFPKYLTSNKVQARKWAFFHSNKLTLLYISIPCLFILSFIILGVFFPEEFGHSKNKSESIFEVDYPVFLVFYYKQVGKVQVHSCFVLINTQSLLQHEKPSIITAKLMSACRKAWITDVGWLSAALRTSVLSEREHAPHFYSSSSAATSITTLTQHQRL